jgi:hypothetical protein
LHFFYPCIVCLLQVHLHTAPLCQIGGISSCLVILMAGGAMS